VARRHVRSWEQRLTLPDSASRLAELQAPTAQWKTKCVQNVSDSIQEMRNTVVRGGGTQQLTNMLHARVNVMRVP
jgi:hypothetical protein